MTRPTKTIKLPETQFEVEYYSYITAGEKRKMTDILTSGISADVTGAIKGDIPLSSVYNANEKAMEMLIVKIGEESDIVKAITDLPASDYDFLFEAINKVSSNTDFSEKKTS